LASFKPGQAVHISLLFIFLDLKKKLNHIQTGEFMKTIIFHHFSYISLKQILLYQTWILQKKKKKKTCRKIFDDVGQCAVFGINSLTKDARHK
jgi:hypothetical protein